MDSVVGQALMEMEKAVTEMEKTAAGPAEEPAPNSTGGQQGELPFAMVEGKPLTQLPMDLYIPPQALEVILEAFEGPLDLLLYLIRRQNLDILDIQVAEITRQYMEYIDLMREMHFELAAEYLVMAAVLAEIKSRMLLPRQDSEEDGDEEDPRVELVRKLQEYERFKQAAEDIDAMPRLNRNFWVAVADAPRMEKSRPLPEVALQDLLVELSRALKRAENFSSHHVSLDPLSTRERMSRILEQVSGEEQFVPFMALFSVEEGRAGVIVTFIALMELIKEAVIDLVQAEPFAPIHVKARSGSLESRPAEPAATFDEPSTSGLSTSEPSTSGPPTSESA